MRLRATATLLLYHYITRYERAHSAFSDMMRHRRYARAAMMSYDARCASAMRARCLSARCSSSLMRVMLLDKRCCAMRVMAMSAYAGEQRAVMRYH